MKIELSTRRPSALGYLLAGALAATACGDDNGAFNLDVDASSFSPPDATTDAAAVATTDATTGASPAADGGADSAADAGAQTQGGDAGAIEAAAPEGASPVEAATPDDAAPDGTTTSGGAAPDAGDAATAVNGDGGATCSGTPSANLIVNGDAESGTGSTDATPVTTPGWTSAGEATALQYGAGEYPALTDPGPADRGVNLFIGGYMDAISSLTQTIDLSADSAQIDASAVTYALSGWLGGYSNQEDYATLTVTFQDGTGTALGTNTIGPVTAEDRADATGLLERSTTGAVPTGTRSALIVLAMVREAGTANDGYADDLSLTLCGL